MQVVGPVDDELLIPPLQGKDALGWHQGEPRRPPSVRKLPGTSPRATRPGRGRPRAGRVGSPLRATSKRAGLNHCLLEAMTTSLWHVTFEGSTAKEGRSPETATLLSGTSAGTFDVPVTREALLGPAKPGSAREAGLRG